jgi:hypothetical protein
VGRKKKLRRQSLPASRSMPVIFADKPVSFAQKADH